MSNSNQPQSNQVLNNQTGNSHQQNHQRKIYPVMDICFTSRAQGLGIHQVKQPLLKYKKQVLSTESQFHNEALPDYNDFQNIQKKEGLIHFYRDMYMNRTNNTRLYYDSKNKPHYYGPKILIVVCMYNQGIGAINLTLKGIYKNLVSLQKQGISSKQVAVVLVQDGILKLVEDRNRRTYAKGDLSIIEFVKLLDKRDGKEYCELESRLHTILDSIDDFKRKQQESQVKQNNDFPPNIQKLLGVLYQNQWKPSDTETDSQRVQRQKKYKENQNQKGVKEQQEAEEKLTLNIFTCFKHMNGKKLSSHLWFFQGFCRYLHPEFVVLLDVGTTPGYRSPSEGKTDYNGLTNLIRGFYADKDIGGVTGLMSIDSDFPSLEGGNQTQQKPNPIIDCLFSIQKAQEYEYIMAHFLDKNFESATGFLHVLPGAWSAYRYIALIKSQKYEQNLLQKSYFTTILNPDMQQNSGYEQQNMYLAEDRILSLGIYCQQKSKYTLGYVPDGVAYTDPMKDHKTLLGQRRRWINSSLFAFLYVWRNYYFNVLQSEHNCYRQYISLNISMIMAGLSFINSYFTPSLYFFVLYITIAQINQTQACSNLATIVSGIYCFIIMAAVGGSLIGKQWENHAHIVSGILSTFTFAMLALVVYNIVGIYLDFANLKLDNFRQGAVIIMVLINIGSFILILGIHIITHAKFIAKLIRDTVSYLAFQGAYSQTMVIHGMCNVDDVSWGTKGATGSAGESKFFTSKVFFVSSWLFYNCMLAYILIYVDLIVPQRKNQQGGIVLLGISIYATVQIGFKTLLAVINFVGWFFGQYMCRPQSFESKQNLQTTKNIWYKLQDQYAKAL